MKLNSFLKLVELPTKIASLVPLAIGSAFAYYRYGQINWNHLVVFTLCLLSLDMGTTAVNNYADFRKAYKKSGYGYEEHNAIVRFGLNEGVVVSTIALLYLIALAFGLLLVFNTDLLVLAAGITAGFISLGYSLGPVPISRTPFGELASGLTMGGLITAITIYINIPDQTLILWDFTQQWFSFSVNWYEALVIALASIPLVTGISNIMLANNICDQADDIVNKRYTLPIFIGTPKALSVYEQLYYLGYLSVALLMGMGVLPLYFVLYGLSLLITIKNIHIFKADPNKATTFILSVKNFLVQNVVYFILLVVAALSKG